ncbi:tocopherol cyclase family protein [Demequina aurantiaca]|uniref:tocopherol cyclase family protein n=1 Tax=Demequina aurantiaca TaxID=676200 RepID=UPI000A065612|nr:tocopherol cyclase family protein [Demequina aurantiaca]
MSLSSVLNSVPRTIRTLAATGHPEGYHGGYQRGSQFFEGWYVKLISADRSARIAIIPGVFLGEHDEAFVQVLDGVTGRSWYEAYDAQEFSGATKSFDVNVAGNAFSDRGVEVNLPLSSLHGSVRFTSPMDPWPVTAASPGIMGRYGWVPVMECYHGLVSFGHDLAGSLTLDGVEQTFDGGLGYIEKDWGRAFPAGYVWMQTNHFQMRGVSLSASIALIPWGRSRFRGFIVGLRMPGRDGTPVLHRFATYTGAETTRLNVDDELVTWTLRNIQGAELRIRAERRRGGLLHAPTRTKMHRRVEETLDGRVHVELVNPAGRTVFEDVGEAAGLEVHGDISDLIAMS